MAKWFDSRDRFGKIEAMMFGALFFIYFFGILLVRPHFKTARSLSYLLAASSLLFIGFLDLSAVILVLAASWVAHILGKQIAANNKRRITLMLAVTGFAILLIAAKIGQLFVAANPFTWQNMAQGSFNWNLLIIPLGLSYLVFKIISYLADIYWGLTKPGTYPEFLAYCSLFTIFTAGPIERWEHFYPQLASPHPVDDETRRVVTYRIVLGLFQKFVMNTAVANVATNAANLNSVTPTMLQFIGLLCYTFQIYFDFAGYSNIAIGATRWLGFEVAENFDRPYLATNLSQFWQRWHMSLSSWIRAYLFFPLSQLSDSKIWLSSCVPVIAMSLCGLWHGFELHYLIWGAWHGLGLVIWQQWVIYKRKRKNLLRLVKNKWYTYAAQSLTFAWVVTGWWWFRA